MPPLFLERFASEHLSLANQKQKVQNVSNSLSEFRACLSPCPALGVGSGSAQSEGAPNASASCHASVP